MWTQDYPLIYQLVTAVLGVLISAALVSLNSFIKQKAGADAAEALANMLHLALETGVKAAENASPGATATTIVNDAITHAMESIPDTIAQLQPTAQTLVNIAMSKLSLKVV